jgi:hypothetical protein
MYRIEVSDADTEDKFVFHVLRIAYELRHCKIVKWKRLFEQQCSNGMVISHGNGLRFELDNHTSYTVLCESLNLRGMIRWGVLKPERLPLSLTVRQEMNIENAFVRIAAVYWVASQQSWKDLAEHFVPYLIAAIGDCGNEETTTKRRRNGD